MSASSEKRKRQMDQTLDKRSMAQREAEEKARKSKRNWTIGGILIVVLVVGILLINAFMYQLPAMKVGNQTYSAAEVRYYYTEVYYTYATYGMVNTSMPLDEQPCSLSEDEDATWADYILEQVAQRLESTQVLCDQAASEGYSLSAEGKEQVQSQMDALKTNAENNHTSLRKLLERYYGEGVTPKVMEKIITRDVLASEYRENMQNGFEFSDEELDAYFEEHAAEYRTYDYLYYFIPAVEEEPEDDVNLDDQEDATPEDDGENVDVPDGEDENDADGIDDAEVPEESEDGTDGEEEYNECVVTANVMASYATDEETFFEAVNAYIEGDEPQLATNVAASNVLSDWLTDEEREYGDTAVASDESGAYVMMFLRSDDQKYPEISVRHILVMTEDTDEDGTFSEEEQAAAQEKAEALMAEWEAGDKTEESFAAMADEHSEDEGSNTNGGLYENVYKGAMVQEFNDFCFAEDRQPGDTGIVHGNNGNYDGYHLMYFVGANGPLHSRTQAKSALVSEAYEEWETAALEGMTVTYKFGMKLATI